MKPMMRKLVSAISLFAVLALPALCLAQNLNSQLAVADGTNNSIPSKCDLAGVWYGGSPDA